MLRRKPEELRRAARAGIEISMVADRRGARREAPVGDTPAGGQRRTRRGAPTHRHRDRADRRHEHAKELVMEAIAHGKHVVTATRPCWSRMAPRS